MGNRNGEFDVSHSFPSHLLLCHLDTATVADNTPVTDSFVLSAVAFIVLCRSEDLLTEKSVPLRLVSPVVDSLRLQDFSG